MIATKMDDLTLFYQQVARAGSLRTPAHAQRWTAATLKTLGHQLDGRTRRSLAKALPPELGQMVTRLFWLVHLRQKGLSALEFQKIVARRAGATDAARARQPILAVFAGIQAQIDDGLNDRVARALPPAVGQLWRQA